MSEKPESELVARVLSGEDPGLTELAAQGILPLPTEELVYVQARLASSELAVAELARRSLAERPDEEVLALLGDTPALVAAFFAEHGSSDAVLRQAIAHRGLEPAVLVRIAPKVGADAQDALLQRQDLIVAEPAILDALERNHQLSAFARRRIGEYRRHLLAPEPSEVEETATAPQPTAPLEELDEEAAEELSEEDFLARVIEDVANIPQDGEVDEHTGLSEGQLRLLSPGVRMRLVRSAGRGLRVMLLRDPNKQVALAVLDSGRMSDAEVELAAGNRKVCEDVLVRISNRREWVQKYRVVSALVKNPRTPVGLALRFLNRLSVRDLSLLRSDRGVSEAIRKNADRMFKTKVG